MSRWYFGIVSTLSAALLLMAGPSSGGPSQPDPLPGTAGQGAATLHLPAPTAPREVNVPADWLIESNLITINLGRSIAPAGDINGDGYSDIIVGAPGYSFGQSAEGAVFAYRGSATGPAPGIPWMAEGEQPLAQLGASVAPAGDTNNDGYADVLVGAPGFDNGQTDEGAAFVYSGGPSGLGSTPSRTLQSDVAGAAFGASVAFAGDVNGDGWSDVVIGAPNFSNGQSQEGRAYLFLGSGTGLSQFPSWNVESNQAGSGFGASVAGAGDVNGDGYDDIVVGAWKWDNGQTDEGRAFLYLGGAGGPSTTAAWSDEADQASAAYGCSVAAAGDVNGDGYADVLIGARLYDEGQADEGAAFLYLGGPGGLTSDPANVMEVDRAGAQFGTSVATAGDLNGDGYADMVIGAPKDDRPGVDSGVAVVYRGGVSTVVRQTPVRELIPALTGSNKGSAVSTAGDFDGDGFADLAVGADQYNNGEPGEGAVYIHRGLADPMTAGGLAPPFYFGPGVAGARLGAGVSAVDVNGDGFSDLLAGAPGYTSNGMNQRGALYLFAGAAAGVSAAPDILPGEGAGSSRGLAVAGLGDVNADGFGDAAVTVADPLAPGVPSQVEIFIGSAGGLFAAPIVTLGDVESGSNFGAALAGGGDVNGDGYTDLLVGAPRGDAPAGTPGRVFLYLGVPSGLLSYPVWSVSGSQADEEFGAAVAFAGDVNGDGLSDILIGAPGHDAGPGLVDAGRAVLYLGNEDAVPGVVTWSVSGTLAGQRLGEGVGSAGDTDGNGRADLIIGSPFTAGAGQTPFARVYLAGPGGYVAQTPINSDEAGVRLGSVVGCAGDTDGDGRADLLVTAPNDDNDPLAGPAEAGLVRVVATRGGTLASYAPGPLALSHLGAAAAPAGDVNGDGFADVVAGAPDASDGSSAVGLVALYYGGGAGARYLDLRQADAAGVARVIPPGLAGSTSSFRLGMRALSAGGRCRLSAEYEIESGALTFDGFITGAGPYLDTGAPRPDGGSWYDLDQLVTDLPEGVTHHWRVRFRSDSPYFPWTRWFAPPLNGGNEPRIRTGSFTTGVPAASPAVRVAEVRLAAPWPNPAAGAVRLRYELAGPGPVRITVHDAQGRLVRRMDFDAASAGTRELAWDARDSDGRPLAAGSYWVRVATRGASESRRIVIGP